MTHRSLRDFFRAVALSAVPLSASCSSPMPPGPAHDGACEHFDLGLVSGIGINEWYLALDGGLPGTQEECLRLCGLMPGSFPGNCVGCRAEERCGYHGLICASGCGGRRPAGLVPVASSQHISMGAYFARLAHLEKASVSAFRGLRTALLHHGAPISLADACRRAALDEIRHARLTGALARRCGSEPPAPLTCSAAPPSLAELARDNAVEGCVREGYGALLATFQAEAARDPEVRVVMGTIAEDETRHADLAWAIAGWVEPLLEPDELQAVVRCRASALAATVRDAQVPVPAALALPLGLPTPSAARHLAENFASDFASRAS